MTGYLKSLLFFVPLGLFGQAPEVVEAPLDNPLKGLVPCVGKGKEGAAFPHAMAFSCFPMKGGHDLRLGNRGYRDGWLILPPRGAGDGR